MVFAFYMSSHCICYIKNIFKGYKKEKTSKSFAKFIKITNVILVENHLHICKNHSQNLRGNIKTIHEGHKDYKCDSCEKSFTLSSYLRKHIKNVHQNWKHH